MCWRRTDILINMKEHNTSFSCLRGVSCLAVILLHLSASEALIYGSILTDTELFTATLIYNLCMWAVPCFLMISGALLLDPEKEISISKLFRKYIYRMISAIFIWGIIYRAFDMVMDGIPLTAASLLDGMKEIYTGTGWSHLWYLYMMTGLYLLLPAFKTITAAKNISLEKYLLLIGLLFLSFLPLTKIAGVTSGFYIPVSTVYPFYFLLGHFIHNKCIASGRKMSLFLIGSGVIGEAAATWFSVIRGYEIGNLTGYSSVFIIILSAGIFILFDTAKFRSSRTVRLLQKLDSMSFQIYLIHIILIRLLLRYSGWNLFSSHPLFSYLSSYFIVLVLSCLTAYLMQKCPHRH